MITTILIALFLLILAILTYRSRILSGKIKEKKVFTINSIVTFSLIGFVGLFIGILFSLIIGIYIPSKTITITECNLKKIDNTCFVGQTLEKQCSYYFFLQDCGENKINKIPTNEVKIVENDSVTPKIEYVINKFENPKNNLWAFPINSKNVIITVPKGTIKVFQNFDLENSQYPDLLFWKSK